MQVGSMDALFALVSIDAIMRLDWVVKGPGIVLIGLFLWRAIRSAFSVRPMTVLTSLVFAFIIAVSLSRFGNIIQNAIYVQMAAITG